MMTSAEKEDVPFTQAIYPRGSVEIWMGEIETMMRRSVRAITEQGTHTELLARQGVYYSLQQKAAA